MNLPNLLTILRIFLVPFFALFLLNDKGLWALLVFTGAGLTDGLDGYIARTRDLKTRLGAFLDPLADKILLLTAYFLLAFLERLPIWLSVIVVARDLIILGGIICIYYVRKTVDFSPTMLGKLTTVVQLLTIFLVLLLPFVHGITPWLFPLYLINVGVTLISCGHYVLLGVRMGTAGMGAIHEKG
jgi:cardiolipin synthase